MMILHAFWALCKLGMHKTLHTSPAIRRMCQAWTGPRGAWAWQAGTAVRWQALGLLLVWAYVVGLHASNDGLWFEGDAARHAANGIFWWDFLRHVPTPPLQFALDYYARYPMIHPIAYPPFFYLLEGVAFAVFGVSPWVAKSLVLLFALLGGAYVMAWLRRWVAAEAGWGVLLLLVQPGVILWSHTIMLNVPAMTMSLLALYYTHRWLEAPASRYLYVAAGGALLVPLTYAPAGVTLGVILAWGLLERRWGLLRDRRVRRLLLGLSLAMGPWVLLALYWAPAHFSLTFPGSAHLAHLDYWLYYVWQIPTLMRLETLAIAGLGILAGLWDRRWRHEARMLMVWSGVGYLGLSYLLSREARYALLLGPPCIILAVGGLHAALRALRAYGQAHWARVFGVVLSAILVLHLGLAATVKVPHIHGLQALMTFLEREAPRGFLFYDGWYAGAFTFYVRTQDARFERGVVLGNKLLYASALFADWQLTERVASVTDVVEALRTQCGCPWLVIARASRATTIAAVQHLYAALQGPEFQLVRSFPITSELVTQIDVYRFLPSALTPQERELPFPNLGVGTVLRAKPIEP